MVDFLCLEVSYLKVSSVGYAIKSNEIHGFPENTHIVIGFLEKKFEMCPGAEFMMIRSFRRFVHIKVKIQISTGE